MQKFKQPLTGDGVIKIDLSVEAKNNIILP